MPEMLTSEEKKFFIPKTPRLWIPQGGNVSEAVSTRDGIEQGEAPGNRLYMPMDVAKIEEGAFKYLVESGIPQCQIAGLLSTLLFGDIPGLRERVEEKWIATNMDIRIDDIDGKNLLYAANLGRGPTRAFKDYAALIFSTLYEVLRIKKDIILATSGDTGGAIVTPFGSNEPDAPFVYVLYPAGRISHVQEQYITRTGFNNIVPIKINGTFDECQAIITEMLRTSKGNFTTANSINLGRCFSQINQHAIVDIEIARQNLNPENKRKVVSIPTGNYGHVTAYMLYKLMNNSNLSYEDYVVVAQNINGEDAPSSRATDSSAMDVLRKRAKSLGRYQEFKGLVEEVTGKQFSKSLIITDKQAATIIMQIYQNHNYLLDPHTAVGVAALKEGGFVGNDFCIVNATADPSKLPEIITKYLQKVTDQEISILTDLNQPFNDGKVYPQEWFTDFDPIRSSDGEMDTLNTIVKLRGSSIMQ
jgi:threonine synthase